MTPSIPVGWGRDRSESWGCFAKSIASEKTSQGLCLSGMLLGGVGGKRGVRLPPLLRVVRE